MILKDTGRRACKSLVITIIVTCVSAPSMGQESVRSDVDRLMVEVAAGHSLTKSTREVARGSHQAVLDAAKEHLSSESERVRYQALMLIKHASLASSDSELRQAGVNSLVGLLNDTRPVVWQHASKALLEFQSGDFAGPASDTLRTMLQRPHLRREVARLVGVANLRDQMSRLRELLIDERTYESETSVGKWYGTVSWYARLAMARMGDEQATDWVVSMVNGESNDIVRITVLLRDLGYVAQPKAHAALLDVLDSDDRLSPTKVGQDGMPAWQYALDVLATTLEKFPVVAESPGSYTTDDRAAAQRWMRERLGGGT